MSPFRFHTLALSSLLLSSTTRTTISVAAQGVGLLNNNKKVEEQTFKIGVAVPGDEVTSGNCTADEMEWMDEKFGEYTVELARLFFRDRTLTLAGDFEPVGEDDFDLNAFEDYNTYEKQKFDVQARSTIKLATDQVGDADPSQIGEFIKEDNPDNGPHEALNSYPAEDKIFAPYSTCQSNLTQQCVALNFEQVPGGAPLQTGQYVADEWRAVYGMGISVSGIGNKAYTPGKQGTGLKHARLFDTYTPHSQYELGSPNSRCKKKGPGYGNGGKPKNKYDINSGNCKPLGKVLIIQEGEVDTPLANTAGGKYIFTFERPVKFNSIGIMNINHREAKMEAFTSNGTKHVITGIENLGLNSVQDVVVGVADVEKLELYIPKRAAITSLNFCVEVCEYHGMFDALSDADDVEACTDSKKAGKGGKGKGSDSEDGCLDQRRRTRTESRRVKSTRDDGEETQLDNGGVSSGHPQVRRRLLGDDSSTDSSIMLKTHHDLDSAAVESMRRELRRWKHSFVYGGVNKYKCRFCNRENLDKRRKRNLRSLEATTNGTTSEPQQSEREYLIGALESVMSFGLTVDLSWSVREWLRERGSDFGCFGDGRSLSVVFELEFDDVQFD